MPNRAYKVCSHPGCHELVQAGKCEKHQKESDKHYDRQRGSAHQRGYTSKWGRESKAFLGQSGNEFCKLRFDGCEGIAQCVDHIDPPDGPNDPRFWRRSNWQSSCIRCNSKKGHKAIKGRGFER